MKITIECPDGMNFMALIIATKKLILEMMRLKFKPSGKYRISFESLNKGRISRNSAHYFTFDGARLEREKI